MQDIKETFTKVYLEESDTLYRYCYFRVSDKERAIDLVQEAFIRAWKYMQEGNEIQNMRAFLYTASRNLIIDEYRKKKNISLENLSEDGFEAKAIESLPYEIAYEADIAIQEIHKLSDSYRDILFLRFVDDVSVQEIAKILELSENLVSVRIHRGLLELRKKLKNHQPPHGQNPTHNN